MKRARGWLVGATFVLGACGSLAAGGCASQNVAIREHDWKHYEPEGGWKAFVPTHAEYEPGTMQAAAGQTSPSPVSASWLEVH